LVQLLLAIIYLSFISLGLPDALLGAAWPSMYRELQVPVSYAGSISMIISLGTIISSLLSNRLTLHLGVGRLTALCVGLTASALFGFSVSHTFFALCLWAIPYGIGAGSVDAALNHYVALHYESKHMSWLHCMWGIGATAGPYIMGFALTHRHSWNTGYRIISFLQIALTILLVITLPCWKKVSESRETSHSSGRTALSLPQILRIPGAKPVMICFFCYCAIEQTTGLWAASYLHLYKHIPADAAARFASLFFIGITLGRAASGFIAIRWSDTQMVKAGLCVIGAGLGLILLPLGTTIDMAGLILIGLGCAPIYPSMLHATPERFGEKHSQAIFGVQMASAYIGSCVMPPLFGLLAGKVSVALLPVFLLAILVLMLVMFLYLLRVHTASDLQSYN
jgi:fucose permease